MIAVFEAVSIRMFLVDSKAIFFLSLAEGRFRTDLPRVVSAVGL